MSVNRGKVEVLTGANFSGSSGDSNRTYGLANSNAVVPNFEVNLSGMILQYSNQFTLSANVITILVPVFDAQDVTLNYFTQETDPASQTSTYATPLELARFMRIDSNIPDLNTQASARSEEVVGVGDNSTTVFWLDNARVIDGSLTLSSGSTEAGAGDLTLTEDYTVDLDLGKITLTSGS